MGHLDTEEWALFRCPHCNAKNWICFGDPSDDTTPSKSAEVLECHTCEKKSWLYDDMEWKSAHAYEIEEEGRSEAEIMEDAFAVSGRRNP